MIFHGCRVEIFSFGIFPIYFLCASSLSLCLSFSVSLFTESNTHTYECWKLEEMKLFGFGTCNVVHGKSNIVSSTVRCVPFTAAIGSKKSRERERRNLWKKNSFAVCSSNICNLCVCVCVNSVLHTKSLVHAINYVMTANTKTRRRRWNSRQNEISRLQWLLCVLCAR